TMPLSQHPSLPYLATLFGTIFLGFGLNYMLRPRATYLSSFGFAYPSTAADQNIMDNVMVLYGAKDVFMAAAIYSATWFGSRKSAGLILAAASLSAGVDGWVVGRVTGGGQWNHWGYGSVMGVLGVVMAG
ncbi:hypothetical protein BDV95DRAFT_446784, partial [Massariosphaeria phaeospora]